MTNDRFVLRPATMQDVPTLRRLIERSVRGLQQNDYTPTQMEGALGHAFGVDARLIEDGTYFVAVVARDPQVIVACGGWSFRATLFGSDTGPARKDAMLDPQKDPAKIRAIFVDPAWARQGLGSLMLGYCEDRASEAGFQKFEMGATLTGVPLYTLRGYIPQEGMTVELPNGSVLPMVRMTKSRT